MFPLLDQSAPNPLELFQIWLNLPARAKMAPPHFTMLWSQDIPRLTVNDAGGGVTEVAVIAGRLDSDAGAFAPLAPPPDSWAAQADSDVAIWTIGMAPGARWTLPAATGAQTRRRLYFFKGRSATVGGRAVNGSSVIELRASDTVELVNGEGAAEFLLLQGRPIGEPVVQYGPFVMNTQAEIRQTLTDYQRTGFGGWPWADSAPVHGLESARFALRADGVEERPEDRPAPVDQFLPVA